MCYWSIALAILLMSCEPATVGGQAGQLLTIGHQLGERPWSRASGEWLALERRNGVFALRAVTVRTARETPTCGDVGFNVSAPGLPVGTFLVRGIPALRAVPSRRFRGAPTLGSERAAATRPSQLIGM